MSKFFFESKIYDIKFNTFDNLINIQIVFNYRLICNTIMLPRIFLVAWKKKKKTKRLLVFQYHISETSNSGKKLTATIDEWLQRRGTRKGRWDGEQKRVSKFPRGDVPEFSHGGGDRVHPCAVPNCHIFHSNECKTYICSPRSPRVDGPDKEEILEISWQITLPRYIYIYIPCSIPVPLICIRTLFSQQSQRISTMKVDVPLA